MNILLLSAGGGGGNILRSLKALFQRDVAVTEETDPQYAERLRAVVTTRFLDTNEFSLADVPAMVAKRGDDVFVHVGGES